jgi:aspartate aminotransferase-like enzyme
MIYENYKIFTPGPVKMSKRILEIGAEQTPYFRNKEFSNVLLSCERSLLNFLNAPKDSRIIFLTASGTAGLESVIMNLFCEKDKALIINGGGFGQRFVDISKSYNINHKEILVRNTNLTNIENEVDSKGYNTFVVNAHETSVGHLYDLKAIGDFCAKNKLLNIVDAISMFVTDEIDMQLHNIDCVILSSQKGLALPPGLTMVALSPKAIKRIQDISSHYFNFKNYLKDGLRGQTPYTPCVSIILQLEERLKEIEENGGIDATIKKAEELAKYFRDEVRKLDFDFYTEYMPNAMTTLTSSSGIGAQKIVDDLEINNKIMVCPNGGILKDKIFRVSHMGDMQRSDIDDLLKALKHIGN